MKILVFVLTAFILLGMSPAQESNAVSGQAENLGRSTGKAQFSQTDFSQKVVVDYQSGIRREVQF